MRTDSIPAPLRRIPIARAETLSLIEAVVEGGYCIGCGACTAVDARITVGANAYGELVARIPEAARGDPLQASRVCPFNPARDETALAAAAFPDAAIDSSLAGRYQRAYKGYSLPYREYGSSGGIGTHVLLHLLQSGQVDHVICVGPSSSGLATYQVVDSAAQLLQCATSFYYPITLEEVLQRVRSVPGRYAVTGVPCFHKALRLLKEQEPLLRERIVFQLGLVCGQMKSRHYADYLARRTGMPGDATLQRISFRSKAGTPRADDYNFVADWQRPDGSTGRGVLGAHAIGFNWGMSYFKPQACDYCDDVYAECADLVIMDAWLPGDVEDARGTSIVLARSAQAAALLDAERDGGRAHLDDCSLAQVIQSQEGGLRHRRQGLRFRLLLDQWRGYWSPGKRVGAGYAGLFMSMEMLFRLALRRRSAEAFLRQRAAGAGVAVFARAMKGPELAYKVFSKLRRTLEPRLGKSPLTVLEVDHKARSGRAAG